MSESQVRLSDFPSSEIRKTLEKTSHSDLLRYMKLYNCRTLQIERRKLDGISLLSIEDQLLDKFGLVPEVLELIKKFRREIAEENRIIEEEKKKAIEADIAAQEEIERENTKVAMNNTYWDSFLFIFTIRLC